MEFESPDVERDFPGLYASESGRKSNESDFSDDSHERPSKKDLLIGKRKDKKESKKDRGYAALEGESSAEEMDLELKSPSKSKKSKSFKFPSKKDKREKSKEKDSKDSEKEDKKEKKKEKEGKVKLKLKERKKSKHGDESIDLDEQPVFGVCLQVAVERSRCHDGVDIPVVVRECIDFVEEQGLNYEGIYRSSGMKSKVQQLRKMYNHREPVNLYDCDPPIVTSLLKQFLRELPEPILTNELLPKFEEVSALKDTRRREDEFVALMEKLPACNRLLLAWIFVHMNHVIEKEKQNKMNFQNIALVLSPTMQISHRVLNALFSHSKTLFKGTVLKKYIPPISAGSPLLPPALPETPTGIEEEIRKQESLLNQIHQEMNAGYVSKRREEQLWEVQRIITQLKRKLRMVQKAQGLSQKSLEEKKTSDDEFKIDLTLQKAKSSTDEDTEECRESEAGTEEEKAGGKGDDQTTKHEQKEFPAEKEPAGSGSSQAETEAEGAGVESQEQVEAQVEVEKVEEVPREQQGKSDEESSAPAASSESSGDQHGSGKEEETRPAAVLPHPADVPDGTTVARARASEETGSTTTEEPSFQEMMQQELVLKLEHQELMSLQTELQSRIQKERLEVERLKAEIAEMRTLYGYRTFSTNSSENSSGSSSEDSDAEEELQKKLSEMVMENEVLEHKRAMLTERIQSEREACIHLRAQIGMLQLQQESKQL